MLLLCTELQVVGSININGVVVHRSVLGCHLTCLRARTVVIRSHRETIGGHAAGVHSLSKFVDIYLAAVFNPWCWRVPHLTGIVLRYRRIGFGRLLVIRIVELDIPVLGEIQRKS